jgi:hypothetical protein
VLTATLDISWTGGRGGGVDGMHMSLIRQLLWGVCETRRRYAGTGARECRMSFGRPVGGKETLSSRGLPSCMCVTGSLACVSSKQARVLLMSLQGGAEGAGP